MYTLFISSLRFPQRFLVADKSNNESERSFGYSAAGFFSYNISLMVSIDSAFAA